MDGIQGTLIQGVPGSSPIELVGNSFSKLHEGWSWRNLHPALSWFGSGLYWSPNRIGFWWVDQTSNSIHCIPTAIVCFSPFHPKVAALFKSGVSLLAAQICLRDTQHLSSMLLSHLKPRDYLGYLKSHVQQCPRYTDIFLISAMWIMHLEILTRSAFSQTWNPSAVPYPQMEPQFVKRSF